MYLSMQREELKVFDMIDREINKQSGRRRMGKMEDDPFKRQQELWKLEEEYWSKRMKELR